MNWNILKLEILLILFVSVLSVECRNEETFHNYNLIKSIQKSAEDISLSKNLKQLSEEDKDFLNAFEENLPKSIPTILLQSLPGVVSDKCLQDLKHVNRSFLLRKPWAMKMVDSYGKPESGILMGNVKWLGSYDECLKVYAPPVGKTGVGDFHGKYCSVQIPLTFEGKPFPLSTAVCLPDSCSPNATFDGMFNNIFPIFNSSRMNDIMESILTNATIACKAKTKEITTGFIVVVTFLSIIALCAVIGSSLTVLEHYLKAKAARESDNMSLNGDIERVSHGDSLPLCPNDEVILPAWLEKCKPFFNCFCIFTNGEKIFNTAGAEGQLPCLHGLRFLSMAWVIVCHNYFNLSSYTKNILGAIDIIDNWTFQVILNGFFCVDSFFVLSGFLVGYLYFKHASKTDGKIPWLYYYIHRYIRLTPVYMIVFAFYTTVSPYLGNGPLWPEYNVIENCTDTWWKNVLYVNNLLDMNDGCMGWSWYLSNDMQFYIVSPLFLITLYKWPKIGYSLMGLFFSIHFTANFAITYEYNVIAGMANVLDYTSDYDKFPARLMDFYNLVYDKPYARIGSYLVGLLVAYIVYKRKKNNCGKLNTITLGICWILASGITLACVFGLYHQKLSLIGASFYNGLSRIGFSIGIGWVIFVCVIGQGNVVNSILSWKPLIPLSRLTYCAYLVHPLVQSTYFGSIRTLIDFNHMNATMLYLGTLFIAYVAGLITSLLFESPVIRLERLLRSKLSS